MSDLLTELDKRKFLHHLWSNGKYKQRVLAEMVGMDISNVQRNIKKFKEDQGPQRIPGSGMSPKLDATDVVILCELAMENKFLSNEQLGEMITRYGCPKVHRTTIGNVLRSQGIRRIKPRRTSLLTSEHKKKRLEWCLANVDTDWSNMWFTDESKFQFYSNNVKVLSRGEAVHEAPKYSPSVMLWGGFCLFGKTKLCEIDGTVDGFCYIEILKSYLLKTANELCPDGWALQQDNAPCHNCIYSMQSLVELGVDFINWPANSPDLNPIENIWGLMKVIISKLPRTNVEEWKKSIHRVWESLSLEYLKALIESMPKRIQQCIENNGGHTKY